MSRKAMTRGGIAWKGETVKGGWKAMEDQAERIEREGERVKGASE